MKDVDYVENIRLKECINYFKGKSAYRRLLEGVREKYRSLGALGGTVTLHNLSPAEKEALSGLLKKDYYSRKSAAIKVENIVKALEGTRFEGVDFEEVLKGCFGGNLISKKEEKSLYLEEKESLLRKVSEGFEGTRGEAWMGSLLNEKGNAYRMLSLWYERDRESMAEGLGVVLKALNILTFDTKNPMRLALFASQVTKNPHAFDAGSDCGRLLLHGICNILGTLKLNFAIPYPQSAEERAELLYRAGIITDEVSNYTMLSGLIGYSKGAVHPGWKGFYEKGEPLQASLWNIAKVDRIESPAGRVFIFENPTVFSEVLSLTQDIIPPLVCTFGQVKLASLILLDRLVESGSIIYYSGDFDPEGLLIADRLKDRYRDKLFLWRYSHDDYLKAKSRETLGESRLKKLQNIKDDGLKKIAKALLKEGCAGYQELLVDSYAEDIKKLSFYFNKGIKTVNDFYSKSKM